MHGPATARGRLAPEHHGRRDAADRSALRRPITAGPEATFASAKIQFCLAGPIGTPAGAQLEFAFFDVNGVFTNPANTTDRIWHATFTPYVAGQPKPNPAGTTEGQAVVPGQVGLTMTTKSLKHGVVIVSGRLVVDGQAFGGGLVELYKPGAPSAIGKARTKANGKYSIRIKIKKKTRLLAQVLFLGDLPACPAPPLPGVPQGCKTAIALVLRRQDRHGSQEEVARGRAREASTRSLPCS